MQVFQTYAEYSRANVRHVPDNGPIGYVCHACRAVHVLPGTVKANPGGGAGYAITPDEQMICYPCADASERDRLKTAEAFGAYLSRDGKRVTTWTGGELGQVTRWNYCRLTRRSNWHGTDYRTVRVVDVHGAQWHGRGSPGIAIKLRRAKA